MASSPMPAPSTVQPSSSRASFTALRMRSSSSTARIRVPTAAHDARSRPLVSLASRRDRRPERRRSGRRPSIGQRRSRERQGRPCVGCRRRAARPGSGGPPRKSPVRQPASRAMSSPAAASQRVQPGLVVGVVAAGGHVAQVDRRRAEAADVADRGRSAAATIAACCAPPGRVVGEAVATSASARSSRSLQRIGRPSSVAPAPRPAANSSPSAGTYTAPASMPSASPAATDVDHSGRSYTKFVVPSIGSTYHEMPDVPGRSVPSSPTIASSGRAAVRPADDRAPRRRGRGR